MDPHCPVCLHVFSFPVQTNCGHLFCASCLISYWKHSYWTDPVSCPLCRQKVRVMYQCFHENRSDRKEREIQGYITDYNKRYSGAPRRDFFPHSKDVSDQLAFLKSPLSRDEFCLALCSDHDSSLVWKVSDYLGDTPLLLMLSFRALSNIDALVWLFLLRVALCGMGAAAFMPDPFSWALGLLDDLLVVFLLLFAIINIHQQMEPERTARSQSRSGNTV